MGFFKELIQAGAKEKDIKIPSVNGNKKNLYEFSHIRNQWLRNTEVKHKIQGNIEIGISKLSNKNFKWSIDFKNVTCYKTSNFIPEYYTYWDFVKRADFIINKKGQISFDFETFGIEQSYKENLEKINRNINDKSRRKEIEKTKGKSNVFKVNTGNKPCNTNFM